MTLGSSGCKISTRRRASLMLKSHSSSRQRVQNTWPLTPADRSEEHTSELQSQSNLVCRLLLEKKKHVTSLRPVLDPVARPAFDALLPSHAQRIHLAHASLSPPHTAGPALAAALASLPCPAPHI